MNIFVDTSVWSLALRRDSPPDVPEVRRLREALGADALHTTGLVLQELLQGCRGPRARAQIIDRFAAIAVIVPTRDDHIDAARLRNACRRRGIQLGTIDALLAQLCIAHQLVMLSTDRDFRLIADSTALRLWHSR
ncbi:MAG: PIN domain-containing protein [Gammaproteobacteria bacterium]|nr:PIN domain-containing protein [Gammaproteobacteria bacterium]